MTDGVTMLDALAAPVRMLFDPAARLFVGHVLLAWLVAALAVGLRAGSRGLWSRRWWRHPSASADARLWILGAVVTAAWIVPALGSAAVLATAVAQALDATFGVPRWSVGGGGSAWPWTVGYSVLLFVVWDASRFALHWLMHRVPALWAIHQVHHSAQVLTPLTLHRVHPIEVVLSRARNVLVTGLVTGLAFHVARGHAVQVQIAGVGALGFLFNALGANLRHSHVWLSYGRAERWLMSPAQHQLHHARGQDRHNLGTALALWDRLAGTWAPADEPPESFGLASDAANHDPHRVLSMILDPLRAGSWFPGSRGGRRLAIGAWVLGLVGWAPQARAAGPREMDATPSVPAEAPETGSDPSTPESPQPPPEEEPELIDLDDDEGQAQDEPELIDVDEAGDPASTSGPAEEIEPAEDVDVEVGTVTILGKREQAQRIAGSAHRIDQDALETQEYDDIHRVLAAVPGVYVRGEDGFGLRPNIGMRGASSDRSAKVTLMEDGVLFGPAPYSAPAAYYFPMTTRMVGVEVFKGPASTRFGPSTVGGAVNLQTRKIPMGSHGQIDVAGGRFAAGKAHGHWGYGTERWGVLGEAVALHHNGFKVIDGGGDTGFEKGETMLKARFNSKSTARLFQQGSVKVGFSGEDSNETYLGLTQQDFDADPYRRYAASREDRMQWWRTQAQASYFLAKDERFTLQVDAYRHDFDRTWRRFSGVTGLDVADGLRGTLGPNDAAGRAGVALLRGEQDSSEFGDLRIELGTNARRFVSQGVQTVARWRWDHRRVRQRLELGARAHADHVRRSPRVESFQIFDGELQAHPSVAPQNVPSNRSEAVAGAFHGQYQLGVGPLTMSPGARVELIRSAASGEHGEVSQFDAVVLPGVGAQVQILDSLGAFAGVHRGFAPPSLRPPTATVVPERVKPESNVAYELGVRFEDYGVHGEVVGFYSDYRNLTAACTFSAGCDVRGNDGQAALGAVHVGGLEAVTGTRQRLGRRGWIDAQVNYTLTRSSFRHDDSTPHPLFGEVAVGDELPYVPRHQGAARLAGGGRAWGIGATARGSTQLRDEAGQGPVDPALRIPGYWVVDADVHYDFTPRARVYGTVDNVLARKYAISRRPFGLRPGKPFSFMLGLKYTF